MIAKSLQNALSSVALMVALVLFSACDRQEVLTGDFSLVSPLPQMIFAGGREAPFVFSSRTVVCYPEGDETLRTAAGLLAAGLEQATGSRVRTSTRMPRGSFILLGIDPEMGAGLKDFQGPESYCLSVEPAGVSIMGGSAIGVLHGIQTLIKALPVRDSATRCHLALPAGTVFDYPEFPYRAFMLDCGRHFFPAAYIKQLIDILALHNLNYFHWHLSEDQGWRLEIKKYPRLTEVGSWRPGTRDPQDVLDSIPVSGFYTQEERHHILGVEACIWTERVADTDSLEWRLLPRLSKSNGRPPLPTIGTLTFSASATCPTSTAPVAGMPGNADRQCTPMSLMSPNRRHQTQYRPTMLPMSQFLGHRRQIGMKT